nr:lasso peptide biosynthesis PqqD family chaperone [Paenibacillus sacheonensis]
MFVRQQGNLVSEMDGDIVMMNIQQGKYYNLGQVGGVIWDLLQNPSTVEELTDALLNEFEITPEECESQVIAFLEQLMKEQLIQSA